MAEAFRLAERGRGLTHPNPLVGAVLVADGQVVGRGWHRGRGTEHAEAVALREAGTRAAGATLFCTLEPCSHHGNTPPCADALVAAGIARAVIALRDPNPLVDGRGLARLRASGVAVEVLDGAAAPPRPSARTRPSSSSCARSAFGHVQGGDLRGRQGSRVDGSARWISSQREPSPGAPSARCVRRGHGGRRHRALRRPRAHGPSLPRTKPGSGRGEPQRRPAARRQGRAQRLRGAHAALDRRRRPRRGQCGSGGRRRRGRADARRRPEGRAQELARRGMLDVLFEGGPTLAGEPAGRGPSRSSAAVRRTPGRGRGGPGSVRGPGGGAR